MESSITVLVIDFRPSRLVVPMTSTTVLKQKDKQSYVIPLSTYNPFAKSDTEYYMMKSYLVLLLLILTQDWNTFCLLSFTKGWANLGQDLGCHGLAIYKSLFIKLFTFSIPTSQ